MTRERLYHRLKKLLIGLDRNPRDAEIFRRLGILLIELKDFCRAVDHFKKAIRLDSQSLNAQLGLAIAFYRCGKIKVSNFLVEEIFSQEGYPPETYLLQAHLFCQTRNYEMAEQAYLEAVRRNKDIQDQVIESLLWGLRFEEPTPSLFH